MIKTQYRWLRWCFIILVFGLSACSTRPIPSTPEITSPPVNENEQPLKQEEVDSAEPVPAKTVVTLAAVGDIMLGGTGEARLIKEGYDMPFADTAKILRAADITLGNLETALTNHQEPFVKKKYLFKNNGEEVAKALFNAGFDIVSLANNHAMDFGLVGISDTVNYLKQYNILSHGAGSTMTAARQAAIIEVKGQQFGFLAYANTFPKEFHATTTQGGTAFGHAEHVEADIKQLVAAKVDNIVVSFHWGRELQPTLRDYQPMLAHLAIDAGADLVIGHHPHILQGIEHYKDGLIFYSLGNFAFSTYSNNVQHSVIAEFAFAEGAVTSMMLTPINVNNFQVQLKPSILKADAAKAVFDELNTLSLPLKTQLSYENDKIIWRQKDRKARKAFSIKGLE